MKYFKKIVGDRLYLSPMNMEDAEEFTKWMNDFSVTDGTGRSSEMVSIISEKEWIEKNSNGYNFSIINLENDELIGNCGIFDIKNTSKNATIGIMIGEEKNRSKGYGTESLNLLIEYGFRYMNLKNIMLKVFSFNERAIASYKKVGFKEIGRRRESYFLNGKYYDEVFMDILSEEFDGNFIKNVNV